MESVSVKDEKIYDKYLSAPLELDKLDKYKILKDNESVTLNEIKSGDILAVASAGKYAVITVAVAEPLIGSVASIDDDELTIAGRRLKLSQSYNSGGMYFSFDPRNVSVGSEGTFLFDADNKIAAYQPGSATEKYAFVIKARIVEEEEEELRIKVLEADGNIVTHKLARKVKIDGITKDDLQEMLTLLKNAGMNGTGGSGGVYQLIAYKENSKGEINYIDTATVGEAEAAEDTLTLDIDDRKSNKTYQVNNAYYFEEPKMFYPTYRSQLPNANEGGYSTTFSVDASVPIFVIPVDENGNMNLDAEEEKNYSVMRIGGLKTQDYLVSAYSLDENNGNLPKAIILKQVSGGSVNRTTAVVAVVMKKTQTVNADGEVVTQLTLLQEGSAVKVNCAEDAVVTIFDNGSRTANQLNAKMSPEYIRKGHTVIYSKNIVGEVTNIDVLYSASSIDPQSSDFGHINPKEEGWVWGLTNTDCKMYGQVLRRSGTKIKVKTENVCDAAGRSFFFPVKYTFFDLNTAKIIIVDTRENTVETGTVNDIIGEEQGESGCYALCTYHNNVVSSAVIYKF